MKLNKTKYLIEPEKEALLKVLMGSPLSRDSLLIQLALCTGGRASELLNILKSDLNPYDKTILIKGLKGSNDRELPIKPDLFNAIWDLANKTPGQRLFPISYQRLDQVWGYWRPFKKKFHALRHTFAIDLYKKTKDIRLVQVALGHKSITNTMVYAEYVYNIEEMKRIIE